jgi:hypothetical protein
MFKICNKMGYMLIGNHFLKVENSNSESYCADKLNRRKTIYEKT